VIWLLYIVHAIVCVVLILVVLLQSGKAADLAGAFGGGSQTALGSRGAATVLSKATTVCAVIFMLTSLTLAIVGSRRGGSVLEQVPVAAPAPAAPAPAAQAPATQPEAAKPQDTGTTPPATKPSGG
jgi:preprotein translocase subunit SecG